MGGSTGAAAGLLRVGVVPALLVCCSAARRSGSASPRPPALATLHLRALHIAMASVYTVYLSALSSLFKLFRGRKFNVLRQRVDSQDYDTEQLLLGTLFFTVLTFLLPTVAAYYTLATVLRAAALSVHASSPRCACHLMAFPGFRFAVGAALVAARRRSLLRHEVLVVARPTLSSSRCTRRSASSFARLRSSVHMADFFFTNSANPSRTGGLERLTHCDGELPRGAGARCPLPRAAPHRADPFAGRATRPAERGRPSRRRRGEYPS